MSKEYHLHNVVQRECTKRCPVHGVHNLSESGNMMSSMIYVKSSKKTIPSPLRLAPPSPRESITRHAAANPASSRHHGTLIHVDVSQLPLQMTWRNRDTNVTIHVELRAQVSHNQNHPGRPPTGIETESDTWVAMTPRQTGS